MDSLKNYKTLFLVPILFFGAFLISIWAFPAYADDTFSNCDITDFSGGATTTPTDTCTATMVNKRLYAVEIRPTFIFSSGTFNFGFGNTPGVNNYCVKNFDTSQFNYGGVSVLDFSDVNCTIPDGNGFVMSASSGGGSGSISVRSNFNSNHIYVKYYWSAQTVPTEAIATVPIQKNIEILDPTYGTTTATTTYKIKIHFKTPFSIDFRPTTTRTYEIVDAVTGQLNYRSTTTIPANSSENRIIEENATTTIGSKFIRAFYTDLNGNIYSEIDEVFFNVATNTYMSATGLSTPRDNPSGLTQIDCGTFEFGCQFQKALTFLFYPSEDALDRFSNLWQTIAEKKPFGYVTVTMNQLSSLDVSGSSAFTLGTVPFMESLFTPFRVAIATILWALYAIYFYHNRLKQLDI